MTVYKYFTADELKCKCCNRERMDEDFMHIIEQIRDGAGFPFPISSAYRCPEHNKKVSSTGEKGPHTTGKAIDIRVSHERAHKVLELALMYNIMGIGVSQKGQHSIRFIHLDMARDFKRLWSY